MKQCAKYLAVLGLMGLGLFFLWERFSKPSIEPTNIQREGNGNANDTGAAPPTAPSQDVLFKPMAARDAQGLSGQGASHLDRIEVNTIASQIDGLIQNAELHAEAAYPSEDAEVFRRVRLYKTSFKYPWVRVEELIAKASAGLGERVLERHAMVADHAIVRLNDEKERDALATFAELNGYEIRADLSGPNTFLVSFPSGDFDVWDSAFAAFSNRAELVRYAEPDYVVFALQTQRFPNDQYFSLLWGMHQGSDKDIDAPEAWQIQPGSTNIIVAVIDTGVDYNHPDLTSNMWRKPGEIPNNGRDDDGNGYIDDVYGWNFYSKTKDPWDDIGHGTHCAGTIGARGNNSIGVAGVCWNVRIMALKFLGPNGGAASDAANAIYYATRNGAKLTSNSWGGGPYSQSLKDAISDAAANGVLFIAAAGNGGADQVGDNNNNTPTYPASYGLANIIAVAATDRDDALAGFSNYGSTSVHLSAPGVDIGSTAGGDYYFMSGTSMAAPHVSGACALIWSMYPSLTMTEVRSRILNNVDVIPSLAGKCTTGGRLNVYKALTALPPLTPPVAPSNLRGTPYVNRVVLAWDDLSNNEAGFHVERRGSGNWSQIGATGTNVASYTDSTVVESETYRYRARSFNAAGNSSYTAEIVVAIPGALDAWDPGDDNSSGAPQLADPTLSERSHGPHTLSSSDPADWFKISLIAGSSYQFNSVGGSGDPQANLYRNASGGTPLASDSDSGGNKMFLLNFTANEAGVYYLRVTCASGMKSGYTLRYRTTAVAKQPPRISWDALREGAVYSVPGELTLNAVSSDPDGNITQVVYRANQQAIATLKTSPFQGTWNTTNSGLYAMSAVAYDNDGLSATSQTITVRFNRPPAALITSPTANARFPAGSSVTIQASATDSDSTIAKVNFYANDQFASSSTSPPFSHRIDSLGAGEWVLKAEAVDSHGLKGQSPTVRIFGSSLPSVVLTSPSHGTTYTAPAQILLTAGATSSNSSITQVVFRAGTTVIGARTTTPYQVAWSNISAGVYTLVADAYDQYGFKSSSGAATITVTNPLPAMPTNFAAQQISDQAIRLTWDQDPAFVYGFQIERSASNESYSTRTQLLPNARLFLDNDVQPSTRYSYRMRTTNDSGGSIWTAERIVHTPAVQPDKANLFGQVAYGGAQTGEYIVVAVPANEQLPHIGRMQDSSAFSLTGLSWNVLYEIYAFRDSAINVEHDFWEAIGVWSNSPILLTHQVGEIVIHLMDPDSDQDGLPDYFELQISTDPLKMDSDGDELTDYEEVNLDGLGAYNPYHPTYNPTGTDTDALNPDSDGDGWPDGLEIQRDTNPRDHDDPPIVRGSISGTVADGGMFTGQVFVVAQSTNAPGGHGFDNFEGTGVLPSWLTYGDPDVHAIDTSTNRAFAGERSLEIRTFGMGEVAAIAILDLPNPIAQGRVSWWHYDETNTPFSVLMSLYAEDGASEVFSVNLLATRYRQSAYEVIGERAPFEWGGRTAGWHQYAVDIEDGVATLFIDGVTVTNTDHFSGGLWSLSFVMHTHHGGDQATWFDLVESKSEVLRFKQSWPDAGPYSLTGLPVNATYEVSAFRDVYPDTVWQDWEPHGQYAANPVFLVDTTHGIDIALEALDSDGDGLSDGFETGYGRYQIMTNRMTWDAARIDAEARGGHLATITSPEEWSAVKRVLGTAIIARDFWLGGFYRMDEQQWTWITGESWQYSRWHPGQPNSFRGGQNALVLYGSASSSILWRDNAITMLYPYILETGFHTDPQNPDTDADGVADGQELLEGTIPSLADTDGDRLTDGEEKLLGSNPLLPDSDGDELNDFYEVRLYPSLNPLLPDTDGDGFADGVELATGTDPCDLRFYPGCVEGTLTWNGPDTGTAIVVATAIDNLVNNALNLNGDGQNARIENAPPLQLANGDFTLCFWLYPHENGLKPHTALLTKRVGGANDGWAIGLTGAGQLFYAQSGETARQLAAPTPLATGAWHHVALSYQSALQEMNLFIDGQCAAAASNWPAPRETTAPLFLGADTFGEWPPFNGMLDEIQLWNRTLPAERLRSLAQSRLTGEEAGLLSAWTFEDGTVTDSGPGQYDGQLLEGASILAVRNPQFERSHRTTVSFSGETNLPYAITNIPTPELYTLTAWLDLDADGEQAPDEPTGLSEPPTFNLTNCAQHMDVTLTIPATSDIIRATQTAPSYPEGSSLIIQCEIWHPEANPLQQASWWPELPDGWIVQSVAGDHSPIYDNGEITFATTGAYPRPLRFSITVEVPADARGLQRIRSRVDYLLTAHTNDWSTRYETSAEPDPLVLQAESNRLHTADWLEPFWVIDSVERDRVIALAQAGEYHSDPTTADGYAPGPGPRTGPVHAADWREPHWSLDAAEVARIIAYHAAGGYRPAPNTPDGYQPGPTRETGDPSSQATRSETVSFSYHGASLYQPGARVTILGRVEAPLPFTSLVWKPSLPNGWQLISVSGEGNPISIQNDILWAGSTLSETVEFQAVLLAPSASTGAALLQGGIEYFDATMETSGTAEVESPLRLDCDRDGDGLPDWAETGTGIFVGKYDTGTDPSNPDTDGDGIPDGDEVLAGTDPNRSSAFFAIVGLGPTVNEMGLASSTMDNRMRLEWASVPGRTYQVMRSTNFMADFENIAVVPALGYWCSFVDMLAPTNSPALFYAIQTPAIDE